MECSIRSKWLCWIAILIIIFLSGWFVFSFSDSPVLNSTISLITAIATSALAIFAYKGLKQWKEEIRGSDKYRALIAIKVKVLNFKNEYQNARLKIINQFSKLSEEQYPAVIDGFKSYYRSLWSSYDGLMEAINFYKIIELVVEKDFLDSEEFEVRSLIIDYITSVDLYCDHVAKKSLLEEDTLSHCKKYLFKRSNEDDEISLKVKSLVTSMFDLIDPRLKEL